MNDSMEVLKSVVRNIKAYLSMIKRFRKYPKFAQISWHFDSTHLKQFCSNPKT